jgi:soluble cytochrome b562
MPVSISEMDSLFDKNGKPKKTPKKQVVNASVGMGDLRVKEAKMPMFSGGVLKSGGPRLGDSIKHGMYNSFIMKNIAKPLIEKVTKRPIDFSYDTQQIMSYQPKGAAENIASMAGSMVQDAPLFMLGDAAIGAPIARALAPKIPSLLARTAGASATGAAMGAGKAAIERQPMPQALKTIGENAAMWGGGELGIGVLGAGFRALRAKPQIPKIKGLYLRQKPVEAYTNKPDDVPFYDSSEIASPTVKNAAEEVAATATPKETFNEYNADDIRQLKDLSGWRLYMTDVYRNFKDVLGNQYSRYKAEILDPFDTSKKSNIETQGYWLNKLKAEVVDGLGIKKGSKESALVQDFGEGKITLEQLKQQRPNDWQKIIEADKWFRQAYDELIDQINAVKEQIYPGALDTAKRIEAKIADLRDTKKWTKEAQDQAIHEIEWELKMLRGNPRRHSEEDTQLMQSLEDKILRIKQDPLYSSETRMAKVEELRDELDKAMRRYNVPKRENYYRHFQEMAEGFAGLRNIFDTPAQISPSLSGISEFTQPKSKWASLMQKRGMGPYKSDAVGGLINYIPAASHAIHIDPHIGKFQGLAEELATTTEKTGNINNFIEYLRDYSNDLAGKTNPLDRGLQKVIPGGRKAFAVINWLNNRVKANVILGNVSSALAQVANVPQGIAFAKQYAAPGAGRALKSIFVDSKPMMESGFLKERFGGIGSAMYRQFDTSILEQPKKFAVWLMETADRTGTTFIWNSAYSKALAQKVPNPVKYADEVTRGLVAGRGVGEVPLLQKSKIFQLVAPFQLEVGNLWSIMRDFTKEKDFGALMTLFVGSWVLNRAMEQARGSGVTFDPIQAFIEAMEEDLTPLQRGGRLAGEVLSNVPLGQTVASMYPEYGMNAFGYELPTRDKLFSRADPTRFGSGLLAVKGLQDPLHKILPPFGGNQLKKTIGGVSALKTKGAYTPDGAQLKYPVATDPVNAVKGLAFGPSGFREARPYYKDNNRPLSEKDTELLRRMGNPKAKYDAIQFKRDVEALNRKIKEAQKDKKLTPQQKAKMVHDLAIKRSTLMQKRGS